MSGMNMDDLFAVFEQLKASGRIQEILDVHGKVEPSSTARDSIEATHPDAEAADKRRLAQAQTVIDLAKKYESELN